MSAFIFVPLPLSKKNLLGRCSLENRYSVPILPTACAGGQRDPDVSVQHPSETNDGPFGRFAIAQLRRILSLQIGWSSPRDGYNGFVEECRMTLARKEPAEQQRIVFNTLNALFKAPYGPRTFRRLFSDKPGLNARITPLFFSWLVGPCSNNRPDEGGYGVYIEKCRFLDETGCKGLCVNMCQQPTQKYFTDVLGLPVRMTPNYEDKSCQMTFGITPLPITEDPAITGDCFIDCKMAGSFKKRGTNACYATQNAPHPDPDCERNES